MTEGAGFRIVGVVARKFVSSSWKFGALTLEVSDGKRRKKLKARAFDAAVIEWISTLGEGETVQVTGTVDSEVLKDKAGKDVEVDGYAAWVPALTVRAFKSDETPKQKPQLDDESNLF